MKKIKKKYISFILVLFGCLALFGVGLKVNAETNQIYQRGAYWNDLSDTFNNGFYACVFSLRITTDYGTNYDIFTTEAYDVEDATTRTNINIKITKVAQGEESYYILKENGQPYTTNKFLTDYGLYALYFYNYQAVSWRFDLYEIEYNHNSPIPVIKDTILQSVEIYTWDARGSQFYTNRRFAITGLQQGKYWGGGYDSNFQNILNYGVFNSYYYQYQYDEVYIDGYDDGYGSGYTDGYDDGSASVTAFDYVWTLLTGIFTALGAFLSIELIPHIPLGVFFFIPLFFGGVGLILWIWRRN